MNKNVLYFMTFVAGAAVGSVATWLYTKKKYERIAKEEIDSVKEVFSKRENPYNPFNDAASAMKDFAEAAGFKNSYIQTKNDRLKEKPGVAEYAAKLRRHNYANYYDAETEEEKPMTEAPYVISPDEFGEIDEYEKISLIYYADKILAADNDDLIENIDNVVGFDSLTRFGEFEDDSVFVRNHRLKCDYEILRDSRTYMDVVIKETPDVEEVDM